MRRYLLYESQDRALDARKAAVDAGGRVRGLAYTTPCALLSELWDVWGDERQLIGGLERRLLMGELLAGQAVFASTEGSVRLFSRFAADYAGTDLLERGKGHFGESARSLAELSADGAPQRAVLAVLEGYYRAVAERGLVEQGEAARVLAAKNLSCQVRFEEFADVPRAVERLLATLGATRLEPCAKGGLAEGVECGLSFPSGATATFFAVRSELVDQVEAFRARGERFSAAVFSRDPLASFEALADDMARRGVVCRVKARVPFSQTMFGRAVEAVRLLRRDDAHWRQAATDFAYNPLAGIGAFEAQRLNAAWRGDRLAQCSSARVDLEDRSALFRLVVRSLSGSAVPSEEELVSVVENAPGMTAQDRVRETKAAMAFGQLISRVDDLGLGHIDVVDAAAGLAVPLSMVAAPGGRAADASLRRSSDEEPGNERSAEYDSVTFLSLADARSAVPRGFQVVVVEDVSDAAWDVSLGSNTLEALAAEVGFEERVDPFDRARRDFLMIQESARMRFLCVAPLRNAAQEEAYPSFVLEEFSAAFAVPEDEGKDLVFGVPASFASAATRFGEDRLAACLGTTWLPVARRRRFAPARRGALGSLRLLDWVKTVNEGDAVVPVLSPSALEAYRSCPYGWFVSQRLRFGQIDERFGALEKGQFAHELFAAFYDRCAREGAVSPEQRAAVLDASFDRVFEEVAAAQRERGLGRLVAVTQAERLEVLRLRDAVRESIRRQLAFPQGFAVWRHEFAIEPEDGVDYAGARIRGRVDRIDVSEQGVRFAVVDYKGSSRNYAAGCGADQELDDLVLPGRTQALVYAQALRPLMGGRACAGAVYVGYRDKDEASSVAGSYDETSYDVGRFAKRTSKVEVNFDRFLDVVEEKTRPLVASFARGDIAPHPSSKDVCEYCPVMWCEKRLS